MKSGVGIFSGILLGVLCVSPVWAADLEEGYRILGALPVQEGGRVKPLSTLAREAVRSVTGKESWEGRPALGVLLDWIADPAGWEEKAFLRIGSGELRGLLEVPEGRSHASPAFLSGHEGFLAFARAASTKKQAEAPLDSREEAALSLVSRLHVFREATSGHLFTLLPLAEKGESWVSIGELFEAYERRGKKAPEALEEALRAFASVVAAHAAGDGKALAAAAARLARIQQGLAPEGAWDPGKVRLEDHLNRLRPFRWAWVLHLAALLAFASRSLGRREVLSAAGRHTPRAPFRSVTGAAGFLFFLAGVAVSTYGFVLRCLVAGRPPVTNMYESLIWVAFGATVFALLFEAFTRSRAWAPWASAAAVTGFLLADQLPTVLDSGIHPLEPVLRSNFWLTVHVLTITLSYAAFTLAFFMAHGTVVQLGFLKPDPAASRLSDLRTYRMVQVGVVLLAAGTILGGVWANESWGRFWGWDPKETWALIALLGYLAVLHGRLAGWLREFGFAAGIITAYLGVLMAWYGVNFVLGAGLHSYGFTSGGGLPWVLGFVFVDAVFLGTACFRHRRRASSFTNTSARLS